MSSKQQFNQQLLSFLQSSPTPFHAVSQMALLFEAAGFDFLDEGEHWNLQPAGKYYTTRNGSSIIAFVVGDDGFANGLRMVGAHTDSPCLKVKPSPEMAVCGTLQLGLEVYGGVLLNPWFDRDLSIAGRVLYETPGGGIASVLLDFARPLLSIPSLAIHLDKEANTNRAVNKQMHLPAVIGTGDENSGFTFRELLQRELAEQMPGLPLRQVLDYEMSLYDTQPPALTGLDEAFIASARLDNLLSCFVGLQALLAADTRTTALLVCNDHEEVGSASMAGAQGPMLKSVLQRMLGDASSMACAIDRSMMISADNAHAIHPNYADRHDGNHGPLLNRGPVIKINANQRYATSGETAAVFRQLCQAENVPVQSFVVRSDLGCGSTIGPITAAGIGVRTIDVGVPQLAMHSVRELAGAEDPHYLFRVLRRFFQHERLFAGA